MVEAYITKKNGVILKKRMSATNEGPSYFGLF